MSLFEVKCPLCKGSLWIDPATQKVVDHKSSDQQKINFEDFLQNQKKGKAWDDKMKKAKEEEARRKAEIEMKFKEAKDSPVKGDSSETLRSPFDWD